MKLSGGIARFWLTAEGRHVLAEFVAEENPIEAFVVDEDPLGAWIRVAAQESSWQLVLLRWSYFSAASIDFQPEFPQQRMPAGFR